MKRLWIGVAVLLVMLAGGVALTFGFSGLHEHLSEELAAASAAAQRSDWEQAIALADSAREDWETYRHLAASFTDHEPLEKLDSLFAELAVCRTLSLQAQYAVVCTNLSELCSAIAESHALNWWNFL